MAHTDVLVEAMAVRGIPSEERTAAQCELLVRAEVMVARVEEMMRSQETARILREETPDAVVPVLALGHVRQLVGIMGEARVTRPQRCVLLLRVGWHYVPAAGEDGERWELRKREPLSSSVEVARCCAITPGSVRALLHRGRDLMEVYRGEVWDVMARAASAMVGALANPLGKHHGSGAGGDFLLPGVADRAEAWMRYWYGD